jgi:hypothetical protein
MKRREFITLLGGGVGALGGVTAESLWGGRAQQPAMPVIAFVSSSFLPAGGVAQLMTSFQDGAAAQLMRSFREGLHDGGYVEGKKSRSNIAARGAI